MRLQIWYELSIELAVLLVLSFRLMWSVGQRLDIWEAAKYLCSSVASNEMATRERKQRRWLKHVYRKARRSRNASGATQRVHTHLAVELQRHCLQTVLQNRFQIRCRADDVAITLKAHASQLAVIIAYLQFCGADCGLATLHEIRSQWSAFVAFCNLKISAPHGHEKRSLQGEAPVRDFWPADWFTFQRWAEQKRTIQAVRDAGAVARYKLGLAAVGKLVGSNRSNSVSDELDRIFAIVRANFPATLHTDNF